MRKSTLALPRDPNARSTGHDCVPTIAPAWHTWLYLSYRVVATWLIYRWAGHGQSAQLDSQLPFYLAFIVAGILMIVYLAWGVRKKYGSLLELVGGRWASFRDFLRDCRTTLVFWVASLFVIAGMRSLLHPPPAQYSLARLIPHTKPELYVWFLVALTAGITEEIVYRGYLQRQFCAWTNSIPVAMVLSAALFGAWHLYQRWKRAVMMGIYGWLLGWLAQRKKSLRPDILAHSLQNSVSGLLLFLRQGH